MALLETLNRVSDALDKKAPKVGVFIDLSKAFDTVDYTILLNKVDYYSIKGLTLEWFKNDLSGRLQYVGIGAVSSHVLPIVGSILGPLLFLIYVNDLSMCSKLFILFAHDINIFFSEKSIDYSFEILNNELNNLSEWFKANKLSLNLKTNRIHCFWQRKKA